MSTPPPPSSSPAAGWYADPQDPLTQRYWDGATWTDHTAPANSPAPTQQFSVAPSASDQRMLGALTHLSNWVAGIIAPLVIYLVTKESQPIVSEHAKEALNFGITLMLISFTLIGLLWVIPAAFILPIVAAVKASNDEVYRYPLTLRLVK